MEWKSFIAEFDYNGKHYIFSISWQETIHLPTVFHVYKGKRFAGQLIYYSREDRWRFFYMNGDNVQELADILGEYVVKGYQ